jgi:cutinase
MPASVASHVAAVALFGTPDDWFLGLVDRGAPSIAIGDPYSAKTIQLCATGDPVCFPGGLDRSAHSSYKSNGMADQAADFVASRLGVSAPAAPVVQAAGDVEPGN